MWEEEKHMTIAEARAILGKEYDKLPDETISGLIKLFSLYSQLAISQHIAEKKAKIRTQIESSKSKLNKERHLANKMPAKATMDQKVKRHIDHVANCKCRPMPEPIKREIQKRCG
jgi:hypothetical protein